MVHSNWSSLSRYLHFSLVITSILQLMLKNENLRILEILKKKKNLKSVELMLSFQEFETKGAVLSKRKRKRFSGD